MTKDLAYYSHRFAHLKADVKPYWPDATLSRAPYKPFLLLSIMDLIALNVIKSNSIRLNADLMDSFDLYWVKIVGHERESNIVMPFNYLRSEGFWHLVPIDGVELDLKTVDRNEIFRRIKNHRLFARMDDELFAILLNPTERDELRRVLIESYFTPDARAILADVGQITAESFEYSRELLNRSRGRFNLQEAPTVDEQYHTESRSTAFRRVVVEAYKHTCAICRVRIVTPEGRTAVAAAHIVPWSFSHNDDPRNGMALCGLHHWAFDQGLITVTTNYQIRVSPVVPPDEEAAQALLLLADNPIYRPAEQILWPARKALDWHLRNIFRAEAPQYLI